MLGKLLEGITSIDINIFLNKDEGIFQIREVLGKVFRVIVDKYGV